MGSQYTHLSNEELLLFADGEISLRQMARTKAHLAACWDCRARLRNIEATITDFLHLHHRTLDPQLPPSAGPRALLRARLIAETSVRRQPWFHRFQRTFGFGKWVYACAVILAVLGTAFAYHLLPLRARSPRLAASRLANGFVPDHRLTPGAVRPMTVSEVCEVNYSDDAGRIPASVKRTVFSEYGISTAQSAEGKSYELDYLISPQLGGTDDIRNLWPEPTSSGGWNLRVKDTLEDRLHHMVCQGKLDLSTAQSELATDWIGAYKRYFHSELPIQPL
jgi:hypothetical protein